MKKAISILCTVLGCLLGAGALAFAAVQAVYWLNLDNKLMFVLYKIFNKITDRVPRDRRF